MTPQFISDPPIENIKNYFQPDEKNTNHTIPQVLDDAEEENRQRKERLRQERLAQRQRETEAGPQDEFSNAKYKLASIERTRLKRIGVGERMILWMVLDHIFPYHNAYKKRKN